MGLRDRLDATADRVATLVSSVFITAPDHPNRGGMTGDESWPDGDDQKEIANGSGDGDGIKGGDGTASGDWSEDGDADQDGEKGQGRE